MVCLLAAATPQEIAPFLEYYRTNERFFHPDKGIDVLITGVGLMSAVYSLGRQVRIRKPDIVVQAGIGGSFKKELARGEVLVVEQDTVADEGVIESEKLKTLFDLQLRDLNDFPYSGGWLVNPHLRLLETTGLKKVKAVSVNQVTTDPEIKKLYKRKFDASLESMEGAALHYVCLQENIPFLQVRAVSNYVRERNKKNWRLKEAIDNLNQELIRLLSTL